MYDSSSIQVIDLRQGHDLNSPTMTDHLWESQTLAESSGTPKGTADSKENPGHPGGSHKAEADDLTADHRPNEARPDSEPEGQQRQEKTDASCRSSMSKLRNLAVKIEKNHSHKKFLMSCCAENLIPKGFELKWD